MFFYLAPALQASPFFSVSFPYSLATLWSREFPTVMPLSELAMIAAPARFGFHCEDRLETFVGSVVFEVPGIVLVQEKPTPTSSNIGVSISHVIASEKNAVQLAAF
jgi:hypothetical protein